MVTTGLSGTGLTRTLNGQGRTATSDRAGGRTGSRSGGLRAGRRPSAGFGCTWSFWSRSRAVSVPDRDQFAGARPERCLGQVRWRRGPISPSRTAWTYVDSPPNGRPGRAVTRTAESATLRVSAGPFVKRLRDLGPPGLVEGARVCPPGMVFGPSVGGTSHIPSKLAEPEHLVADPVLSGPVRSGPVRSNRPGRPRTGGYSANWLPEVLADDNSRHKFTISRPDTALSREWQNLVPADLHLKRHRKI